MPAWPNVQDRNTRGRYLASSSGVVESTGGRALCRFPKVVGLFSALLVSACFWASAQTSTLHAARSDPAGYSQNVRRVLGLADDGRYAARWDAVASLGNDLRPQDTEGLLRLLAEPSLLEGLAPIQQAGLLNEVMRILRLQQTPPSGLEEAMMALCEDRERAVLIRDYAVQQLMDWYPNAGDRQKLEECFFRALNEQEGAIAGTAILALTRVVLKYAGADRERVENAAWALASDATRPAAIRVSALQACAQLGVGKALPLARDVAANEKGTQLGISAIAVLGYLGDGSDIAFLERLCHRPEGREYAAANAALNRLTKRLPTQ